ncbi:hypothetical protein [Haloarcula sp. CBA1129]|uniref:hypothetical protein n=1 Tax=Haloarcula sp. CBA1129 TaxID=1853684 RepID=UPI001246561D|nr:hypothetical protein [Haloarcula sp. CBA1129]KAA9399670.1 hypothetical protein Har1129_16170 [Haloarcula sp. CBA1129]
MMDKIKQIREAKAELENPHESDRINAIAEILAEIESAQRRAVVNQREALGIDPDDGRTGIDKDGRQAEIIDVVDAQTPGGPSLAEVWLEQCVESVDGDPAALAHYSAMDSDEWTEQIERWADTYRNAESGEIEASDRDLADHHISQKWGVSLSEFEQTVVQFNAATALEDLLAGPSKETEQAIEANTEVLA